MPNNVKLRIDTHGKVMHNSGVVPLSNIPGGAYRVVLAVN